MKRMKYIIQQTFLLNTFIFNKSCIKQTNLGTFLNYQVWFYCFVIGSWKFINDQSFYKPLIIFVNC